MFNNDISTCPDCGTPTFDGMPHGSGHDRSMEALACTAAALAGESREHVILVAISVEAPSRRMAEAYLMQRLPRPGRRGDESIAIDSWWVAEDVRYDRSDNDSAVFCIPGVQEQATACLRSHGLAN